MIGLGERIYDQLMRNLPSGFDVDAVEHPEFGPMSADGNTSLIEFGYEGKRVRILIVVSED
jgi:hypothetical protein